MVEFMTNAAMLLVGVIACLSWVFVARHSRTRWWEDPHGRYLMKSKTGWALIFTIGLMFRVFEPPVEVVLVTTIALYSWIVYVLSELLILQTRAWRESDKRHDGEAQR